MVKTENLCMNDFDEGPIPRRSLSKGKKESKTRVRVFRNPFLNFISDFRKSNTSLKSREVISRAAEQWRKMNPDEKSPYCELARSAPKSRKRKAGRRRRRRRRRHD
ncbi:hypothetical protein TcasGA2_TC007828 [Tribolium castaneum]|uniref:HMG box domain-containing protein n=1 Tax=Tribolium castaneum TaxID=7070 RepID=D2A2C5_TRICA|nr:hypothetical protein TcasGA2_TC007828 [Tribolium castaneum]